MSEANRLHQEAMNKKEAEKRSRRLN